MSAWTSGSIVGEYRLVEPLGAGAMGVVWRVVHVPTGVERALKANLAVDVESIERFKREARALAGLEHPNVGRVHTAGEHAGRLYLVMDLAPGGDLAARLKSGPLAPEVARTLARDLGLGLAHVHSRGLLHRDLKPANVLFDEQGRPLLVDFGLARRVEGSSLTQSGAIVGTPSYMAPEQVEGLGRVDERSDVYGLGAVLFHALTGRAPFVGQTPIAVLTAVMSAAPPDPRELDPRLPAQLADLCQRALAKDPSARPQSANAFAEALAEAPSGGSPSGSWVGLSLAAALACVVVVALLGRALLERDPGPPAAGGEPTEPSTALEPANPEPGPASRPVEPVVEEHPLDRRFGELQAVTVEDLEGCPRDAVRKCADDLVSGRSGLSLESASGWLWRGGERRLALALLYRVARARGDGLSVRGWGLLARQLSEPGAYASAGWSTREWEDVGRDVVLECYRRGVEGRCAGAFLGLGELLKSGSEPLGIEANLLQAMACFRAVEVSNQFDHTDARNAWEHLARLAWKHPYLPGRPSDVEALGLAREAMYKFREGSPEHRQARFLVRSLEERIANAGGQD